MAAKLSYLLLFFTFSHLGFAQAPDLTNPSTHKNLIEFQDPVNDSDWKTISARVWSDERTGIRNRKVCGTFSFASNNAQGEWKCNMRFVINADIMEWPVQNEAYAIVNGKKYQINLLDAHSRYYHIKDENPSTDAEGNLTTTISTRDFQLFKKECNMTTILEELRFIEDFAIIVYSADIPILFTFDDSEMNRLQAVLR